MCQLGKALRICTVPRARALTGYRHWGWDLRSVFIPGFRWSRDDRTEALGRVTMRGSRGLWAFHSVSARTAAELNDLAGVRGQIKGWGVVVIHEKGFRCQYATIVRLTKGA